MRPTLSLIVLICAPGLVLAAGGDGAGLELECSWSPPQLAPFSAAVRPGQVAISAGQVDLSDLGATVFRGQVDIQADEQRLLADKIVLDRTTDKAVASGHVQYVSPDLSLSAEAATVDLAADGLEVSALEYFINPGQGRGAAQRAARDGKNQTALSTVTFTACPAGNEDWLLAADEMVLDHALGRGTARNLTLRFKDVPILYLPRASFPLDDRRKSGFLVPGIGGSSDDGVDFSIPYYFNLAPHHDLTLTPRLITDRGAMLMADYRYLGNNWQGEIGAEHLPDDDRTGNHRSYAWWRHDQALGRGFDFQLDFNHVSDDRYFEDLGNSLSVSSLSLLRSLARIGARGNYWSAALSVDAYESIDDSLPLAAEPYERLPRLEFDWDQPLGGWRLRLESELTAFHRDQSVDGVRLDILPRVSYPLYGAAWFLQPSIGLRYTRYDLDGAPGADALSRTTAIGELEGRLIFERTTGPWLQTLEPRLYFLYVPFEEQSQLPDFDTRELTFGFSQLFRYNRFSGGDRQGDASQVTVAVTSRLLDTRSGNSPLEVSVGAIAYLRDRRVQLASAGPDSRDTSPLVLELAWRPSDAWRINFGFQYEPDPLPSADRLQQAQLGLSYRGPNGRIVNFAYRRRSQVVEQVDTSVWLPLNERWSVVGRVNYSIADSSLLESMLGFEYDSCCWTARVFGRRYVRSLEGNRRNALYVELELKGLGSLGRSTGRVLERSILGYQHDR